MNKKAKRIVQDGVDRLTQEAKAFKACVEEDENLLENPLTNLCLPLFPLIQVPWLLQFFSHLQKKTSHASPAYPSEHLQKPVFWQRPCPEHCFGHAFKTHDTPTNPWLHVHLPVLSHSP